MDKLISVQQLCSSYEVKLSFIHSLDELGLIKVVVSEEREYVYVKAIGEIERMIRLHSELELSPEGIETTVHLLQRIEHMQEEIRRLKARLSLYEE